MNGEFKNMITSSLNAPYSAFCEEYIRLAELIIFFDKDQMEIIDKAEEEAIVSIFTGMKTLYSSLGEERTRKHFNLMRSRLIDQFIKENDGVRKVYETLNDYVRKHSVERQKLNLSYHDDHLNSDELYMNYLIVVDKLKNFDLEKDAIKKK